MKFMLLQDYGAGVESDIPPMSQWKPEEVEAHINYQKDLNAELRERGELVEAQALTAPELASSSSPTAPHHRSSPMAHSRSRRSFSPATG